MIPPLAAQCAETLRKAFEPLLPHTEYCIGERSVGAARECVCHREARIDSFVVAAKASLAPLLATVEREQERLQGEVDRLRRTLANDPSRAGKRLMNLANALSTCDTCEAACDDVDSPVVLCGKCHQFLTARVQALEAERTWQPIETCPKETEYLFWLVPKTPEEAHCDTSGNPIFHGGPERMVMAKFGHWSSLTKATHWQPLPPAIHEASKEPK